MQFTLNDQAACFPCSADPLLSLLTLMLGWWYLVLPLQASFQDSLVGGNSPLGFMALTDVLLHIFILPFHHLGDRTT